MQHAGLFLFSWLLYRFCSINTIVLLTIMSNSESLMKTSDFFYQKPIGVITYTWIYNNLMVRIIIIWFRNSLIHDFVILYLFSLFFFLYSLFVQSIFKLFFPVSPILTTDICYPGILTIGNSIFIFLVFHFFQSLESVDKYYIYDF